MRRALTLLLTAVLLLSPLALSSCGPGPFYAIYYALTKKKDKEKPPPPVYQLTTTRNPSNGGTVEATAGGLSVDANGWFVDGTVIDMTAIPATGFNFSYWSGDMTNEDVNTCQVIMDAPKTVTAYFSPTSQVGLTVTSSRGGNPNPPEGVTLYTIGSSISCTVDAYAEDTSPTRYKCIGWTPTGDVPADNGTNDTGSFTINVASTITYQWQTQHTVSIDVSDPARGTASLSGGSPEGSYYPELDSVTIQATANASYTFDHWEVNTINIGSANPHILSVTEPASVLAVFEYEPPVADFTANPTTGFTSTTFTLTDASTGNVTSWSWDFGVGASPATASTQGPHSVTYSTTGSKTVSLSISGPGGTDTETKADCITVNPQPDTIYVATTGDDITGDGTFGNPYETIQKGLDSAATGTTVIVLDGTYTGTTNKNLDFTSKDIYLKSAGGAAACIIDCELSGRGFYFHSGETNAAIIEGFTIQNGNANFGSEYGGGIYCDNSSPTIRDCTFAFNSASDGGAIGCTNGSNPRIANCLLTDNTVEDFGGGIACYSSSPTITRCTISNNSVTLFDGGGISCRSSSAPDITNCLITQNTAADDGGGIYCDSSTPTITNCTIADNSAADGGGIACGNTASPVINNTIMWGNTVTESGHQICFLDISAMTVTLNYCVYADDSLDANNIEGNVSGNTVTPNNCIVSDPLFVGGTDYHLQSGSPCIDKGNNGYVTWSEDLDGNPRISRGFVDIGTYEFQDPLYDTNLRWVEKTPQTSPTPRTNGLMAYDSARGVIVLFGGGNLLGDTWEYDGKHWWKRNPVDSPPGRNGHSMVYDSQRNKVVLFGGFATTAETCETWEWDGTNWTDVSPGGTEGVDFPSARSHHEMAYDSTREVVVLFGGLREVSVHLGDTWEWNGTTWTDVSPGGTEGVDYPSVRDAQAMAYDPARGVTVLFGGWGPGLLDDTWEWDGTNWTKKSPANSPSARMGHTMVYDSARGVVVLFGGDEGTVNDETWEFGGTNWTQKSLTNKPSIRYMHEMTYDSRRQKVVLFGGYDGSTKVADTWEYGIFPLEIETNILPDGEVGTAYNALVSANYGTTPYTFSLDTATYNKDVPPGLTLNPDGSITGTPTQPGKYPFLVSVTDSSSPQQSALKPLSITIPADGGYCWTHRMGDSDAEEAHAICTDASGNVYVTGWFGDGFSAAGYSVSFDTDWGTPVGDTKTTAGSHDIFITKMDASGNYCWTHSIGSTFHDTCSAVCVDGSNNVYLAGYFWNSADFAADWGGSDSKTSAGQNDAFITKIDADGNYCWTHRMGGSDWDSATAVCTDASGNVYVAGQIQNNVNCAADWGGSDTKTSAGSSDVFITRINADGTYGWTHRMGGPEVDTPYGICVGQDGNLYVTGQFTSASVNFADDWGGNDTKANAGVCDIFITKMDTSGNYLWTYRAGGADSDTGRDICADGNGNIYVTGEFRSSTVNFAGDWSLTDTKTLAGGGDSFIMKIEESGNYLWTHRIGGTGFDKGEDIYADAGGNIYVAGDFEGAAVNFAEDWGGTDSKNSAGADDICITKIDANGNYVWTRRMGDTGGDEAWAVCTDRSGEVYVTGYFSSTVNFAEDWGGTDPKSTAGGYDAFITKISNLPWSRGKDMPTERSAVTASAVNGIVYIVAGYNATSGSLALVEAYDPSINSWSTKASLPAQRVFAASCGLNGKIYVMGGQVTTTNYANLYEYDPGTNIWTEKTPMTQERTALVCCAINGKLYAIGGCAAAGYLDIVEEYDPVSNTWSTKTPMPTPRDWMAATVVNGKIYVIGGTTSGGQEIGTVEIYDPAKDSWTTGSPMPTARWRLDCCVVNGKIYAIGGTIDQTQSLDTVEEYDPVTDTWTTKASLPVETRALGCAVVNGKIYAAGGYHEATATYLSTLQIYDPVVSFDLWLPGPDMPTARIKLAPVSLNGKVYAIGGYHDGDTLAKVDVYDPQVRLWYSATDMPMPRGNFAASIVNGKIYIVGGDSETPLEPLVAKYNPATDTWDTKASIPTVRGGLTSGVVNGKIYAIGGGAAVYYNTVEEYSPLGNTWATGLSSMPTSRNFLTSSVMNGEIYVFGGRNTTEDLTTVEAYDPVTDTWMAKTDMPGPKLCLASALVNGKIYVIGGHYSGGVLDSVCEYDPATDTWRTGLATVPTPRTMASACAIDGVIYYIGGNDDGQAGGWTTVEMYIP